jgi:hypothetical protein
MFTSLAIAPIVNVFTGPKADGRWPSCGRRGQVGRREGTPQNEEGTRSEPRRSEPTGGGRRRDVLKNGNAGCIEFPSVEARRGEGTWWIEIRKEREKEREKERSKGRGGMLACEWYHPACHSCRASSRAAPSCKSIHTQKTIGDIQVGSEGVESVMRLVDAE